jgi:hypothetical protein
MSFGSAASLPGVVPQAPLSPATVRSVRPFTTIAQSSGGFPPAKRMPLQRAAEDPPLGRVLLVEDDPAATLEMQCLLKDLGYRILGPVSSATEAERLIERTHGTWPLHCALLDIRCLDVARVARLLTRRNVPIVWLVPHDAQSMPVVPFAAPVLRLPTDRIALRSTIRAARRAEHHGGPHHGRPYTTPQEAWPRIFPQL